MAKTNANVATEQNEFPLMLDEFCSRLSTTDKRVELIGAFHHSEKVAGRNKDTESKFAERFLAFCKQPA